ncbi:MAG: enoyl-CoA hydratase/isomerase family protein [Proteobacteria bacterium]|nr:enoyl-CoA hydratase/isomerase family protein [Pseudomonadota bacterium]
MTCELFATREAGALVLTFADTASRNRLSAEACVAAIEALNTADSDDDVRAVIVRGDGNHFCSGAEADADTARALTDLLAGLAAYPKPVLAVVEGQASGAGWALALACDAIAAAEGAVFKAGEPVSPGLARALDRTLPRPLAWAALWLGQPVEARTLHAAGQLTQLVDSGQAHATALAWAQALAERDAEPLGELKAALASAAAKPARA